VTRREDNYFSDMSQWNNRGSYLQAVEMTVRSGCSRVGIDISENQLEYPFQALVREHDPQVQFVHTGVGNAVAPCAVLCLDCAGNHKKISLYTPVSEPITIGRFLLFLTH
jgi:hypothetical protein